MSAFLAAAQPRTELALVYVQHLFAEQHSHLLRVLERRSHWPVCAVDYGSTLRPGWVTVPSAEERLDIDDQGVMGISHGGGWRQPYRPNIDEVAGQLLGYPGYRVNLIVFTGMGCDGCTAATQVAQAGGRVWVQEPASCQARAMPEAVLQALPRAATGTVAELAERFNAREFSGDDR